MLFPGAVVDDGNTVEGQSVLVEVMTVGVRFEGGRGGCSCVFKSSKQVVAVTAEKARSCGG